MTPNHYQNHRENRLRREACEQWQGILNRRTKAIDCEMKAIDQAIHDYHRLNTSARSIDAERSKRQGVPRQELSRGEWILQCVVLGLVVVAVAHAITGPW